MNSNLLIRADRAIQPVNDVAAVEALWTVLVQIPDENQNDLWVRSREGGHVCLFSHNSYPGKVLEYVAGGKDDSITSLYRATSIFGSRADLMKLRIDLIRELKAMTMTVNDSLTLYDSGRERHVRLKEMGTAQLIDTIRKFSSTR